MLSAERGIFHAGFRQLRKIQIQILKGFQGFIQSHSKLFTLIGFRQTTGPSIRQEETIDHNGIFPRKNLCTEDIETAFSEHPRHSTEQARPVPGANTDIGAAAIQIALWKSPWINIRFSCKTCCLKKSNQLDVYHDFIRRYRPKIPRRQIIKMRLDFIIGQETGNQLTRLFGFNFIAVLLFRPRGLRGPAGKTRGFSSTTSIA